MYEYRRKSQRKFNTLRFKLEIIFIKLGKITKTTFNLRNESDLEMQLQQTHANYTFIVKCSNFKEKGFK